MSCAPSPTAGEIGVQCTGGRGRCCGSGGSLNLAPANGDSRPLSGRTGLAGSEAERAGAIGWNASSGQDDEPGGERRDRALGRGGVTNACSNGLGLFSEGCAALG